jgi:hypothetical protein
MCQAAWRVIAPMWEYIQQAMSTKKKVTLRMALAGMRRKSLRPHKKICSSRTTLIVLLSTERDP